jgi:CHAT domain-containing protein
VTIALLPSATLAPDSLAVTATATATTLVAIGDPAFDESLYDLPRLPATAEETRLIAREYRDAIVLTASNATRENLEHALSQASVVHLATHAVVIPNTPLQSYLVLAPSGGDRGSYPIETIERTSTGAARLIVLTGCRTAAAEHGAPVASLALAFLAAGATNVVGSLWDLPDNDMSVALSVRFHRALRAGATPAAALRDAQLTFLRSDNVEWRRPSSWATYQVYTARSQ